MASNSRAGLGALLFRAALAALLFVLSPGLAIAATVGEAPQQFPIRDFFSNPDKAYFRLSEDGKTLGFMQPVEVDGNPRRLNVFVQKLDGSKPVGEARRLTGETARDIGIYYWKGNNTILYEKDFAPAAQ